MKPNLEFSIKTKKVIFRCFQGPPYCFQVLFKIFPKLLEIAVFQIFVHAFQIFSHFQGIQGPVGNPAHCTYTGTVRWCPVILRR